VLSWTHCFIRSLCYVTWLFTFSWLFLRASVPSDVCHSLYLTQYALLVSCLDLAVRFATLKMVFPSVFTSLWLDFSCFLSRIEAKIKTGFQKPLFMEFHKICLIIPVVLIRNLAFIDLTFWIPSGCRVSTTSGNLFEFVWSSWKLCIKCRWSTTLVSNHDKTGYLIASLRNWSPFLYLCHGSVLCISCFCYIFRQTSRFGTLHSRPKQCKHVLDFSWNPSWNLLEICSVKFVDTLGCKISHGWYLLARKLAVDSRELLHASR